jgi:hypothetical protein
MVARAKFVEIAYLSDLAKDARWQSAEKAMNCARIPASDVLKAYDCRAMHRPRWMPASPTWSLSALAAGCYEWSERTAETLS